MSRRLTHAVAVLAACGASACRSPGAPPGGAAREAPPATPGIDATLIDRGARPCDSFYQFACGGWIARTPIPPDRGRWVRGFTEVEERNLHLLREIAEADAAGRRDAADRYPDKVGDLYAACMDEEAVERGGLADLRAAWARVDAASDVPSVAGALAFLHERNVPAAFQIEARQDAKDATQMIGVVAQGGLTLPDRDYYLKDDARSRAIQEDYRRHAARMLGLAGVAADEAEREAQAVYGLERDLAEAHWTRVELRDPKRTYNRVELAGLESRAPRFPWKGYLEALGHGGTTSFSATTPRLLERLDGLLARAPLDTWRAYLRWRLLAAAAAARAVPRALVDESFAFESRSFTGAKEQEARWKHCVRTTDAALGQAIGQGFVRRHFGADGKAKTSELVSNIEAAMGRDLDGLAWMDPDTRRRAHEKLGRIVNKIGYPDAWRSYDTLRVERASFLRSLLAANAFEVHRQLSKVGKPLDRGEWRMTPATVNAYYNSGMNEIVFPAGILQPPFYTRGAPDAVNYGAAGMVVGHEISHGFDDRGRQFDALGNLADWWSEAAGKEFERRAACVVSQFDGYAAVEDVKVNGKLTLGENIADLAGLKLALAAYRASRQGKGGEAQVAGFTPEQAFFVGAAQAWCAVVRPEQARLRAATDPHSPPRWRIDGPLSNLPEFREAFSCPDGSAMVRPAAERCAVW
jgi:putative endopeptidase